MATVIRNGRECIQMFISSICGPREYYYDLGPAPPVSRGNRALMLMHRLERKQQTGRRLYAIARAVAVKELFGVNT